MKPSLIALFAIIAFIPVLVYCQQMKGTISHSNINNNINNNLGQASSKTDQKLWQIPRNYSQAYLGSPLYRSDNISDLLPYIANPPSSNRNNVLKKYKSSHKTWPYLPRPGLYGNCAKFASYLYRKYFLMVIGIVYHMVNTGEEMPTNFVLSCSGLGYVQVLFEMNHFSYFFIFFFYIVFIIRYTLKKSLLETNTFWGMLHALAFFLCLFLTTLLYLQDFIGLNFFGICGISSLYKNNEKANWNIVIPLFGIVSGCFLFLMGIFTYRYYNKHMPEGQFKLRKAQYSKIIFLFVIGFSLCELIPNILVLIIALYYQKPQPKLLVSLITISNITRILEYYFTILLIVWNDRFRQGLKAMLKKLFMKLTPGRLRSASISSVEVDSMKHSFEMEEIVVNEKLLQIKDRANQIDLLFISQIFTIISGLFAVYYEYFQVGINGNTNDKQKNKQLKNLVFKQSITIQIDNESIKNYEFQTRIMLKIQILKCRLTFFCPKYFYNLLQADRLDGVHLSFKIMENVRKICTVADGQGGRSGEFFFFSADRKYIVKTITREEFVFLKTHLLNFSQHYTNNPQSMIAKIYGLMIFKGDEIQRTYRIIIMKNITGCMQSQILRVYDLKGSKHNREVVKERKMKTEANQLESKTLKDIDFTKYEGKIMIDQFVAQSLRQVIRRDVQFLRDLNIIDYSLLVIRIKWPNAPENPHFWHTLQRIPHKFNLQQYYHIGLIDYLQPWDFQKKSERWWKKLTGKTDISAINPRSYCIRFLNFVDEISINFNGSGSGSRVNTSFGGEMELSFQEGLDSQDKEKGKDKKIEKKILNLIKDQLELGSEESEYEESSYHKPEDIPGQISQS